MIKFKEPHACGRCGRVYNEIHESQEMIRIKEKEKNIKTMFKGAMWQCDSHNCNNTIFVSEKGLASTCPLPSRSERDGMTPTASNIISKNSNKQSGSIV